MATLLRLSDLAQWPAPNYANPVTHGSALMAINIVFLVLATIIFVLRLYTKIFLKRNFGAEDVFMILAWIFTVGIHINITFGVQHYGWDRHTWDIPLTWTTSIFKLVYAAQLFFLVAAVFTANSMLIFYYNLSRSAGFKYFQVAVLLSLGLVWITWLPFFFLHVFPCRPVKAYWVFPPMYDAKCTDIPGVTFGGGVVKLFIDVLVTTLPIPLIARLNITRPQKIGIVIVLALGYLVCIAGALRLYYCHVLFWQTTDDVWYQYPSMLASVIENDLGIICACLPFLRPLFGKRLDALINSAWNTFQHPTADSYANEEEDLALPVSKPPSSSIEK